MNIVTIDSFNTPPFTMKVEYLLGVIPRTLYDDGTKQFVSLGENPKIYSPRLSRDELEEFCKTNIERYQEFRSRNEYLILTGGELPEIEKFW